MSMSGVQRHLVFTILLFFKYIQCINQQHKQIYCTKPTYIIITNTQLQIVLGYIAIFINLHAAPIFSYNKTIEAFFQIILKAYFNTNITLRRHSLIAHIGTQICTEYGTGSTK